MADWTDTAKKSLELFGSSVRALELVGNIARDKLATDKGGDVIKLLHVFVALADVVRAGFDGKISGGDVAKHIDHQVELLHAGLVEIDADDKSDIDKLFPR